MNEVEKLRNDIETALGRSMQTPRDFDHLSKRIYARLHLMVSATTLKRIWGYLNDGGKPRNSTLTILAKFLGYRDWEEFHQNAILPEEQQSDPVYSRRLSVVEELQPGDRLRLTWLPGRVCDIEYLGGLDFRVVASEKTRLRPGDTFQCSLVVEGEPLYLDHLVQEGRTPIAYVCGKKNGVEFEFL
ncbi:MAG: hypothetical protein IKI09_06915 [Bacteroidales bacterium]|nr:hypothetical protein [Bacteroidales bacterium]